MGTDLPKDTNTRVRKPKTAFPLILKNARTRPRAIPKRIEKAEMERVRGSPDRTLGKLLIKKVPLSKKYSLLRY
jgi:hypothetical protein